MVKMPKSKCAFCPETANMSGEHLWSDWMNQLSPGKKQLVIKDKNRQVIKSWTKPELDWTANVVCETCNNEWMSDIENDHAKPSMSELIVGKLDIPINQERANSIALFAFKTAVIIDHLKRDSEPFFEESIRYEFKKSRTIPENVDMWLTGFAAPGRGEINTLYGKGSVSPGVDLTLYVCTYAVEHFVIQTVAHKTNGVREIKTNHNFAAIPFWPAIPDNFVWPPSDVLRTIEDFDAFSDRWGFVDVNAII
jgi:hypothetical protein